MRKGTVYFLQVQKATNHNYKTVQKNECKFAKSGLQEESFERDRGKSKKESTQHSTYTPEVSLKLDVGAI